MKKFNKSIRRVANNPIYEARLYGYFGLIVVFTVFYTIFWGDI
ncbi:MAG: hypothetical protein QX195_10900 [Methylococcaceae bacterium]|jgi:hypothetical protein